MYESLESISTKFKNFMVTLNVSNAVVWQKTEVSYVVLHLGIKQET
jgi:hypothetical protein